MVFASTVLLLCSSCNTTKTTQMLTAKNVEEKVCEYKLVIQIVNAEYVVNQVIRAISSSALLYIMQMVNYNNLVEDMREIEVVAGVGSEKQLDRLKSDLYKISGVTKIVVSKN